MTLKNVVVFLGITMAGSVLASPTLKFSAGGYSSQGDYGLSSDTQIQGIPVSAQYRAWPWKLKLSGSYVHLKGPGTLEDADLGNGSQFRIKDVYGFGDTSVTIEHESVSRPAASRWYWSSGIRVKLPTGERDKGLGTGEADLEPRFMLMWLNETWRPYVRVKYTIRGNPDDRKLDNGFGATLGVDVPVNPQVRVGAQVSGRESSTSTGHDRLDVLMTSTVKWDSSFSSTVYVSGGLKEGSADYLFGVDFSYSFKL
ncbi:MAG: transporter [Pseudomonadales bacterium]|nr:transporter [Pseudomonadales bacterium]